MGAALLVFQTYRRFLHDGGSVESRAECDSLSNHQELCGKEMVAIVCFYLSIFNVPVSDEFFYDAAGLCDLRLSRAVATDKGKEMVFGSTNFVAMFIRSHLGFGLDTLCICWIDSYWKREDLGLNLYCWLFDPMVQRFLSE